LTPSLIFALHACALLSLASCGIYLLDFIFSDAMDWGIALESESDDPALNSCRNSDADPPSTPIKLVSASTCTPPKTRQSVVQARALLARAKLVQRKEIAAKKKELKKWAADSMRAEKMTSKFVSAGRMQQLATARQKKAEIRAAKENLLSSATIQIQ
jgi:hypothetical protein